MVMATISMKVIWSEKDTNDNDNDAMGTMRKFQEIVNEVELNNYYLGIHFFLAYS